MAISVEREDFDGAEDGAAWLSSLIGLRGDIASGDERPLYLAWLLGVQYGHVDDEVVEPGRPDGLGHLSPSLASFVDIVGLDRDLVAAAAEGGVRIPTAPAARDIDSWLARLGPDEHVALLSRMARGDGSVGAEIMRRIGGTLDHDHPACRCGRLVHCVNAPKRSRRRGTRLPGSGRLGLAHGANSRNRPSAIDIWLAWPRENAKPCSESTRSSARSSPATTQPRSRSSWTCATSAAGTGATPCSHNGSRQSECCTPRSPRCWLVL